MRTNAHKYRPPQTNAGQRRLEQSQALQVQIPELAENNGKTHPCKKILRIVQIYSQIPTVHFLVIYIAGKKFD